MNFTAELYLINGLNSGKINSFLVLSVIISYFLRRLICIHCYYGSASAAVIRGRRAEFFSVGPPLNGVFSGGAR